MKDRQKMEKLDEVDPCYQIACRLIAKVLMLRPQWALKVQTGDESVGAGVRQVSERTVCKWGHLNRFGEDTSYCFAVRLPSGDPASPFFNSYHVVNVRRTMGGKLGAALVARRDGQKDLRVAAKGSLEELERVFVPLLDREVFQGVEHQKEIAKDRAETGRLQTWAREWSQSGGWPRGVTMYSDSVWFGHIYLKFHMAFQTEEEAERVIRAIQSTKGPDTRPSEGFRFRLRK